MAGGDLTMILQSLARKIWFPAFVVLGWEFFGRLGGNAFFPAPSVLLETLVTISSEGFWTEAVLPSLTLMLLGFTGGSLLGILAGVLIGTAEPVRLVLEPIIVFLRSIPTAAKVPVLLGIVGIGQQSLLLAVILAVFFNVTVVTTIGVSRVPTDTLDAAEVLGLSHWRKLVEVRVPAASADIVTGVHNALQISVLVAILVETLASARGLGNFITDSLTLFRISELWVGIAVLGGIGLILNEGFHALEKRVIPWYFEARGFTR